MEVIWKLYFLSFAEKTILSYLNNKWTFAIAEKHVNFWMGCTKEKRVLSVDFFFLQIFAHIIISEITIQGETMLNTWKTVNGPSCFFPWWAYRDNVSKQNLDVFANADISLVFFSKYFCCICRNNEILSSGNQFLTTVWGVNICQTIEHCKIKHKVRHALFP